MANNIESNTITVKRLKEALELRHMNASELSKLAGISKSTISYYLKGRFQPKQDKIYQLSQALRVSPSWLMGLDVDMEKDSPKFFSVLPGLHVHTVVKPENSVNSSPAFTNLKSSLRERLKEINTLIEESESLATEDNKIPVIASVKCGYDGFAYEYSDGCVSIDRDIYSGIIKAFRCYGDSMSGIGIFDGDIALVRIQDTVENGELAIIVIDGEEGTLKRIRQQEGALILESANPSCPPRVFTGEDMNRVRIVGKVIEIRRKL